MREREEAMPRTVTRKIKLMPCGTTATMALDQIHTHWSPRAKQAVQVKRIWTSTCSDSLVVFHRKDYRDSWSELAKHFHGECRLLLLSDDEPVEPIIPQLMRLGIRDEKRVHVVRLGEAPAIFLRRFAEALGSSKNADDAIFDAYWEGDEFVVVSPDFERLQVPLTALPTKLRNASLRRRENFKIDEYGEYIYWPDLDVHMGWPQFEQAVNPMARLVAEQKSHDFNRRYGEAIRKLREDEELSQKDISGLNDRTIRRIEQGHTRVTGNAIKKLAKAHKMTPAEYMAAVAEMLEDRDDE